MYSQHMTATVAVMVVQTLFCGGALASPTVESLGERVRLNWSTAKLEFYGEAQAPKDSAVLRDAEKSAWSEGLRFIGKEVAVIHADVAKAPNEDSRKRAVDRVTRTAYSTNTTYFADGRVRVDLETALSRLVLGSGVSFATEEIPELSAATNSAIVVKTAESASPKAVFEVVTPEGEVLHQVSGMSRKGFVKNTMGRWFSQKRASASEVRRFAGKKPAEISGSWNDKGQLVIDKATWEKARSANEPLLQAGKLAILLP